MAEPEVAVSSRKRGRPSKQHGTPTGVPNKRLRQSSTIPDSSYESLKTHSNSVPSDEAKYATPQKSARETRTSSRVVRFSSPNAQDDSANETINENFQERNEAEDLQEQNCDEFEDAESAEGDDSGIAATARKYRIASIKGFPHRSTPIPAGLSLEEICLHYPNHLVSEGLDPFMGVKGALAIWESMPEAAQNRNSSAISKHNFMQKRIAARKKKLIDNNSYDALVKANILRERGATWANANELKKITGDYEFAQGAGATAQEGQMDIDPGLDLSDPRLSNPVATDVDESELEDTDIRESEAKKQAQRIVLRVGRENQKNFSQPLNLDKSSGDDSRLHDTAIVGEKYTGFFGSPEIVSGKDAESSIRSGGMMYAVPTVTHKPRGFRTPMDHQNRPLVRHNTGRDGDLPTSRTVTSLRASQGPSQIQQPQRAPLQLLQRPFQPVSNMSTEYQSSGLAQPPTQPTLQYLDQNDFNTVMIATNAYRDIHHEVKSQLNMLPHLLLLDPRFEDKSIAGLIKAANKTWCREVIEFKMRYPKTHGEDIREPPLAVNEPLRNVPFYLKEMRRVITIGWERNEGMHPGFQSVDENGVRRSAQDLRRMHNIKQRMIMTEMQKYIHQWTAQWNQVRLDFYRYHPDPAELVRREEELDQALLNHQMMLDARRVQAQEQAQCQGLQHQGTQQSAMRLLQNPDIRAVAQAMPNSEVWLQQLRQAALTPANTMTPVNANFPTQAAPTMGVMEDQQPSFIMPIVLTNTGAQNYSQDADIEEGTSAPIGQSPGMGQQLQLSTADMPGQDTEDDNGGEPDDGIEEITAYTAQANQVSEEDEGELVHQPILAPEYQVPSFLDIPPFNFVDPYHLEMKR